jgi:hypothetical protein
MCSKLLLLLLIAIVLLLLFSECWGESGCCAQA